MKKLLMLGTAVFFITSSIGFASQNTDFIITETGVKVLQLAENNPPDLIKSDMPKRLEKSDKNPQVIDQRKKYVNNHDKKAQTHLTQVHHKNTLTQEHHNKHQPQLKHLAENTPPGLAKKGMPNGLEKSNKRPHGWDQGKKQGWNNQHMKNQYHMSQEHHKLQKPMKHH